MSDVRVGLARRQEVLRKAPNLAGQSARHQPPVLRWPQNSALGVLRENPRPSPSPLLPL